MKSCKKCRPKDCVQPSGWLAPGGSARHPTSVSLIEDIVQRSCEMRQKTYFDLEEDWAVRIGNIPPNVRDRINEHKLLTDFARRVGY